MMREGLWTDEAISVFVATASSPSEFLVRNRTSDYTPPLFNAILAAYTRLAGTEEMPLKALAMTLGLLALGAGVALAWEVGGPVAAVLAAAFLVNNPILIDMSAELRAYSLSALLASVGLLQAFRLHRRGRAAGPAGFVGLAVILTLLIYSHVAGGIVVAVLLAWGILEWLRRREDSFGRRLASSAIASCAAYLFWLPTTLRQARIGLPWEKKLTFPEWFHVSVLRTDEALPIPQAFGQPLFVIGIAAVLAVAVLLGPRVRNRLRGRSEPLVVLAIAAAAVWVVLGLYTRQSSRYLIIPAVFVAVVFASVLARVLEAAKEARPGVRAAAVFALAALVVSSFLARKDMYEGRFEVAARPKSGVRSLCRARLFEPGELAIVVPDYLAPIAWYYCGRDERLRGFVRWEQPYLFDPSRNRELWRDPSAASKAVSRIEEELRSENRSRFTVLLEETPAGLLPLFEKRVDELMSELERNYDTKAVKRFPGRLDSARAIVWSRR